MSCRSTAAGSAFTTYARLESGLSDVQTLSTFHVLRHEGRGCSAPSEAEWQQFVSTAHRAAGDNSDFSDARRRSLQTRLERALTEVPDGPTWHALRNIRERAGRQAANLTSRFEEAAAELGLTPAQVRERFETVQAEVDRPRGGRPEGYVDARDRLRGAGLPEDHGSWEALRRLDAEVNAARAARAETGERRVTLQSFAQAPGSSIVQAGYDADGGRLEVVFSRTGGGTSRIYAYTGVPAETWEEMRTSPHPGVIYNRRIRNHSEFRYATQAEEEADAVRRRCGGCGQFMATSGHTCPPVAEPVVEAPAPVAEPSATTVEEIEAALAASGATPIAAERPRLVMVDQLGQVHEASEYEPAAAVAVDVLDPEVEVEGEAPEVPAEPEPEPETPARPEPRTASSLGMWPRTRHPAYARSGTYGDGGNDYMHMPNLTEVRSLAQQGPVTWSASLDGYRSIDWGTANGLVEDPNVSRWQRGRFRATGTVVFDRPGRGQYTVEIQNPRCNCYQYQQNSDCPHIRELQTRYQQALTPTRTGAGAPLNVEQAQQAAEVAMQRDWMRNEELAKTAEERWRDADDGIHYSKDFAAYEADRVAAAARKAAGEDVIPYMRENATDGLLTREAGRGFGVELELDFPSTMGYSEKSAALQAIGREMHAAGLTSTPNQQRYHASAAAGYTENHQGGWSFEQDCTVAGEIVSPVMFDEPETWDNIAKVCEIVKRNGGVASARTGSHVHIGSKNTQPTTVTELGRMVTQYEDVIYKMNMNPDRATHRPLRWCGPNRDVPEGGYATVSDARRYANSHGLGLNLQSVSGGDKDHVEFRHADGSLNPAVIQSQVKMAAAMMAAAERNGRAHAGKRDNRPREAVGSHHTRLQAVRGRSRRALTSEELASDSATMRSFLDTLFRRREDKAQLAALDLETKWMRSA